MIEKIQRVDNFLERTERGLAVVLYILLVGLICATIIGRNLLQIVSHRLMELAPAVVLWLALVGATLALKHQRHIRIELLLHFLPSGGRRMAIALTSLFGMGVCGVLAYAAVYFVYNETILFGAWGWLSLCFPLFFLLAFFRFGLRFLQQCHSLHGKDA